MSNCIRLGLNFAENVARYKDLLSERHTDHEKRFTFYFYLAKQQIII